MHGKLYPPPPRSTIMTVILRAVQVREGARVDPLRGGKMMMVSLRSSGISLSIAPIFEIITARGARATQVSLSFDRHPLPSPHALGT